MNYLQQIDEEFPNQNEKIELKNFIQNNTQTQLSTPNFYNHQRSNYIASFISDPQIIKSESLSPIM